MINEIVDKLESKKKVFLTGGAGVGKTTLTKSVISHYEQDAKKVAKLASTGMAATLIGGQTLHSFLDLGIAKDIEELQKNSKYEIKTKVQKLISSMDLIVIDEISMVSDTLFEMIALRLEQSNFKGMLLVVGDFLQLPPVVRGYSEVHFAFESAIWEKFNFEIVELTHIYRTDDKEFIELLAKVREGFVDEDVHNELNSYIKPLPQDLSEFTFLFAKNDSAAMHNRAQLALLDSELHTKEAQIIKHVKSVKDADVERFMDDARIERTLEIKIGAPVLFTRNSWNYFNGERGVVVNIDATYVYVQKSDLIVIKLERVAQNKSHWVQKSVDAKLQFVEESLFSIFQFPIKPSYAITIHKSQGMSIVDLVIQSNEIFAPSQFYVAISRSSNPKRLNLIAPKRQWRDIIFVNNKAMRFVKNSAML